jgi:hypothetical protein
MDRHSIRGTIKRFGSPLLEHLRESIGRFLDLFVRIRGTRPRDRDKPVYIGMRKSSDQTARATASAGFLSCLFAHDQLSQPERESLLPDSDRPSEKKYLREPTCRVGPGKTLARCLMTDQRVHGVRKQGKPAGPEW